MTDAQVGNILIVGESDASEGHVRGLLAAGSFRCTCTSRTSEACLIAREPSLDAALVDASTLDTDEALRLTTWLRQEVPWLPVVLVDGSAPAHGVFEALRLGVIDYLRAPVTAEEIGRGARPGGPVAA